MPELVKISPGTPGAIIASSLRQNDVVSSSSRVRMILGHFLSFITQTYYMNVFCLICKKYWDIWGIKPGMYCCRSIVGLLKCIRIKKNRSNIFRVYFYQCTFIEEVNCITHWGRGKMATIFKCILLKENIWLSIKISLNLIPKETMNNIASLVHKMLGAGDKQLSEPMMA